MKFNKILISSVFAIALLSACTSSTTSSVTSSDSLKEVDNGNAQVSYKPDAPRTYIVQPGDTLWSISARYLDSPWQWKRIWKANPNLKNPNRIFPGDELELVDGMVSIKSRGKGGIPTIKLEPGVQVLPLDLGIPAIKYTSVEAILSRSIMSDMATIRNAPYIVGLEFGRIEGEVNSRVYIRGNVRAGEQYLVFRQDRDLGRAGIELIRTGEIAIEREAPNEKEFASAFITSLNNVSVRAGDIILPKPEDRGIPELYFQPDTPPKGMSATIIASPLALSALGLGQTVIIDKGSDDGIKIGHVFVVESRTVTERDPRTGRRITLPNEASGSVMVYRTFPNSSFALIMSSPNPIFVGTTLSAPKDAK